MDTIIRDGASQDDRMLPALRPSYIRPDELALPELLHAMARHAGLVSYFGLDDQPCGDWQPLFAGDETTLLATMLAETARLGHRQREFQRCLAHMQAFAAGFEGCPGPDEVPLWPIAELIEGWRGAARRIAGPAAERLHDVIEGLLPSTLAPALSALAAFLGAHDPRHAERHRRLGAAWHGVPFPALPDELSSATATGFLRDIFLACSNALTVIGRAAGEHFAASIPTGRHDPAAGLVIAFAQLYLRARERFDDYSQRQLRFCYERLLGFRARPSRPDSAYLVLTASGAGAEAVVPRGTRFIGWQGPDGAEVLYAATEDLRLGDARVTALRTLHFERDPLRSPEHELGYVSAARVSDIPPASGKASHPLFGAVRRRGEPAPGHHARLGFAVASGVLTLAEGVREISVALHFQPSGDGLDGLLDKLCASIPTPSREGAFFKAFAGLFRVALTTAGGWREVPSYLPDCCHVDERLPPDCLVFHIELAESFPAVVGCDGALHGAGFDTAEPLIRFVLSSDNYLFGYGFLAGLVVREVDVEVRVRGCRNLQVFNNHGQLNAAVPFMPFGPLPTQGAPFVIGSREVFSKQLTRLALDIQWEGLPESGLESRYRAYGSQVTSASFLARLEALNERAWLPADAAEQALVPLFGAGGREARCHLDCGRLIPYIQAADPGPGEVYSPLARGGFIRLRLVEPAGAFGHAAYPQLMARALTRNARLEALGPLRRLFRGGPPEPLPEAPYTPVASAISLDYAARASIATAQLGGPSRDRLFHLHPFGVEALSLDARGETRVVPPAIHDASLFIGIEAEALGGVLSLHFHMRDDSSLVPGQPRPRFSWFHLAGNRWLELDNARVLADTTQGFLASGVVQLDLPPGMQRDNTVMDGDRYWLRVATSGPADAVASVLGVRAHGLRVERVVDEGPPVGPVTLPAGSIRSATVSVPGLASILQPADSFGGESEESHAAMIVRASERLRHRQRAVTPWDYERLALQRFPHLEKVKCFPNTRYTDDPTAWHRPGEVLVVVSRRGGDLGGFSRENVLALQDIRDYLQALASPAVRLDVRNPVFDRIQVRCAARFHDERARGFLIQQLNQDICDYISPWGQGGRRVGFGWFFNVQQIQAHLQALPYVQAVWGISLLRVIEEGARYILHDTAREAGGGLQELRPVYPWSIAVPFRHHLIETGQGSHEDPSGPWPSGISSLQLGSTFIISGSRHGEKE